MIFSVLESWLPQPLSLLYCKLFTTEIRTQCPRGVMNEATEVTT